MAKTTPRTHLGIDRRLCGEPRRLAAGRAEVELATGPEMAADDHGLVHGGFVFGLADYAAMLAVNHPNVVLGAAETRFLAPAVVGERLIAEAVVEAEDGRRRQVAVTVRRGEDALFSGTFTCFVLAEHVLGGRRRSGG